MATLCVVLNLLPSGASADSARNVHISSIIGEVRIIGSDNVIRAAVVNDQVSPDTIIETTDESRVELTSNDGCVARLGAKTSIKFNCNSKILTLREGAGLFQIPPASAWKIDTERLALSMSGVTTVFEYHANIYKLLVLQGTGRLYHRHRLADSMLINAGQMVFGKPASSLSEPVDFDIQRFVSTSRLVTDFPPLNSDKLLGQASQQQELQKSKKVLLETKFVIHGGGTLVSVEEHAKTGNTDDAGAATVSANSTVPSLQSNTR